MSDIDSFIHVTIPNKPRWWFIKGHNGMITYNVVWLAANALDQRMIIDGLEVRLEYLSIEEMPIDSSKYKKDE